MSHLSIFKAPNLTDIHNLTHSPVCVFREIWGLFSYLVFDSVQFIYMNKNKKIPQNISNYSTPNTPVKEKQYKALFLIREHTHVDQVN